MNKSSLRSLSSPRIPHGRGLFCVVSAALNSPASISPTTQAQKGAACNSESATRRRCTATVGRAHANALAVCKFGQLIALHCATAAGEIIITVDEADFNAACRGPRDHNGNPFTAPVEHIKPADLPPPPDRPKWRRKRSPEYVAAMQRILAVYEQSDLPVGAIKAACAREGMTVANFHAWRTSL